MGEFTGFGGLPGLEAHGGYTFCSIAALAILEAVTRCDLPKLLNWLIMRQCPFEGGFNGRTNKLVDTCYSFWQAGAIPIVYRALSLNGTYLKIQETALGICSFDSYFCGSISV